MSVEQEIEIYRNNPEELYTTGFYKQMRRARGWQASVGKCMAETYGFNSAIDFGCGIGSYLQGMKQAGVENVFGYEFLRKSVDPYIDKDMKPYIKQGSLMDILRPGKFEWVQSIEVVEHLLPEASDVIVTNLTDASCKYLFFTAAVPGQGGVGHINEREQSFWIEKIEAKGFKHLVNDFKSLKEKFALLGHRRYPKKFMLFEKI